MFISTSCEKNRQTEIAHQLMPLKILPKAPELLYDGTGQHTLREWADELQISPNTNESFEDLHTTKAGSESMSHKTKKLDLRDLVAGLGVVNRLYSSMMIPWTFFLSFDECE